jgi:hypothetical protein
MLRNLYFYGASDDLHEADGDLPQWREEFQGCCLVTIDVPVAAAGVNARYTPVVHWQFDGDWSVWTEGDWPPECPVRYIAGNCGDEARRRNAAHRATLPLHERYTSHAPDVAGMLLHVQVPENVALTLTALGYEPE